MRDSLSIDRISKMIFSGSGSKGEICVLFECYLDDSKDQKQEFSYVCAGFYGARWAWNSFNVEWRAQLKAEGIAYFKTNEWKSLTNEFQKFKLLPEPNGRKAANLVRGRLRKVLVQSRGLKGIAVAVPVNDWKSVMEHEGADLIFSKNLYHRAFDATLLKATESACYKGDKLAFVHDDGNDFSELLSLYNGFKAINTATSKRMAGFIPLDDKETPALQIADMFANEVMGKTVNFFKGEATDPNEIILFNRSRIYSYSREFAEAVLAANLERRELPIPESLGPALDRLNGA